MKKSFKKFIIILILFTIFLFITLHSYANNISEELSQSFFRLHIIANSDSTEDQNLKLKVRDSIVEYMKSLTSDLNNKQDVILNVKNHINDLQDIAQKVIVDNGYNYPVKIDIGNFYFPTKYYGNISLPAGYYDALKIEIGEANGQNWWCSLFPPLCFINISAGVIEENGEKYLEENLSDESLTLITSNSPEIELKFKIVELLNF